MDAIARKNGMSLNLFRCLNPNWNPNGYIYPGQVFKVLYWAYPGCTQDVCYTTPDNACPCGYQVMAGDSCWDIATRNGLTFNTLLSMNPGLNCYPLSIGVVVRVNWMQPCSSSAFATNRNLISNVGSFTWSSCSFDQLHCTGVSSPSDCTTRFGLKETNPSWLNYDNQPGQCNNVRIGCFIEGVHRVPSVIITGDTFFHNIFYWISSQECSINLVF